MRGRALILHRIENMATPMKYICLAMFLAILGIAGLNQVDGAGECGRNTTPDMEAFKLAPCSSAAQDENSSVSSQCCARVKKIGQNPACLCAVMLSNTAKSSGIKPQIAMTIPKRCNIADRPVGYKCGGTLYFTLKNEDHELHSPYKVPSYHPAGVHTIVASSYS
ncbi:hypothetical protein DKX38_012428 [Salix brachista]|uniref:Bifunctional inhibitor/plant lipid transfer protein/seed storage helical domain-containing protein n=1 Tax=Salix brachista TaxID=2182728 RepID=A0A5N5LQT8_9ROSI|nr:hypothetical protein DKX38_012428 [Salix brachista]